jgi:hypothetical protein
MKTIILLVISLVAGGASLYRLSTNKSFGFYKTVDWIQFFISMFALCVVWLDYIFPGLRLWWDPNINAEGKTALQWAQLCAVLWIVATYFIYLAIEGLNSHISISKVGAVISLMVSFVAITLIILASFIIPVTRDNNTSKKLVILERNIYQTPVNYQEPLVIQISKGGSLCGSLKIKPAEALQLAKIYKLKYSCNKEKVFVLVHPKDSFIKIGDIWAPVKRDLYKIK